VQAAQQHTSLTEGSSHSSGIQLCSSTVQSWSVVLVGEVSAFGASNAVNYLCPLRAAFMSGVSGEGEGGVILPLLPQSHHGYLPAPPVAAAVATICVTERGFCFLSPLYSFLPPPSSQQPLCVVWFFPQSVVTARGGSRGEGRGSRRGQREKLRTPLLVGLGRGGRAHRWREHAWRRYRSTSSPSSTFPIQNRIAIELFCSPRSIPLARAITGVITPAPPNSRTGR
jgi:hypothetical protein